MAQGKYTENYNFYIPDGSELGLIIKLVLEPNFTITDQQLKSLSDIKFNVAGGTITDDVVMQKDLVVNGTISTNALILNGWKITIK